MKKLLYVLTLASCSYMVASEGDNTWKLPQDIMHLEFPKLIEPRQIIALKHAYECKTKAVVIKKQHFLKIAYVESGTEKSVYYKSGENGKFWLVGDRACVNHMLAPNSDSE